MDIRSTRSEVTFQHDVMLPGSEDRLPAGRYDLVIEEERLQGLTFDAYRRTATYLVVGGGAAFPGRTEMRPIAEADLQFAIDRDRSYSATLPDGSRAIPVSPMDAP